MTGREGEADKANGAAPAKEYAAVEPVPAADRNIGAGDMFATWVGANANNGTWYVGGVVAAVCFVPSLYVTALANPVAYVVMALVGLIGFRAGVSTMALTRFAFGIRGSVLPSLLNTTQFIGWTAVNTYIAAVSVSFVLKELWGWPALGEPGGETTMLAGIALMSVLHLVSIAAGHNGFRRGKPFTPFWSHYILFGFGKQGPRSAAGRFTADRSCSIIGSGSQSSGRAGWTRADGGIACYWLLAIR